MLGARFFLFAIAAGVVVSAPTAFAKKSSAASFFYGVCEHPDRHSSQDVDREFKLMRDAGVQWVRFDFSWSYFQPKPDQWCFDKYDKLLDKADQFGIKILPILCYSTSWSGPAQYKLDCWREYVKRVVSRYHKRLKIWEVWNEENISFWKPKPDAREYVNLLKVSYKQIKAVDPECQVMLGGLAGVPMDYIRDLYKNGAKPYFEIMAVHPYRYPGEPEATGFLQQMAELRKLMAEYGDGNKPIWITEIGWPTHIAGLMHEAKDVGSALLAFAAQKEFGKLDGLRVGIFYEKGFPGCTRRRVDALTGLLKQLGWKVSLMSYKDLLGLDRKNLDVLVFAQGEHFPLEPFPKLVEFVRDGGLFVHFGGVPFYYPEVPSNGGAWKMKPGSDKYRKALHIAFHAWWTRKGTPKETSEIQVSDQLKSQYAGVKFPFRTTRYMNDARCKKGDTFVPLIEALQGGKPVGAPVAYYDLKSDLRGGVLIATMQLEGRGVTEAEQAKILPRIYLLGQAAGLRALFWYDFRNDGTDKTYNEHNFGIVRFDFTAKPAWTAMKVLTSEVGALTFVRWMQLDENVYLCIFRGDDEYTLAAWDVSGKERLFVPAAKGTVPSARNHLGDVAPVALDKNAQAFVIELSPSVTYIRGVKSLDGLRVR